MRPQVNSASDAAAPAQQFVVKHMCDGENHTGTQIPCQKQNCVNVLCTNCAVHKDEDGMLICNLCMVSQMSFEGTQRQASKGNSDDFSGSGVQHYSGVTIDRVSKQVVGWDTIFEIFNDKDKQEEKQKAVQEGVERFLERE